MWVHGGTCLIIVRVKPCAFLPANVPARVHLWVKRHKKPRILETLQNGKMKFNPSACTIHNSSMPHKCLPQALRPNQSPLCSGQYTSLRVQHRPPPRRGPHHKSHTQNSLPAVAASPRRRLHLLHCLTYISYMQTKRHHPSRPAHSGLRGWVGGDKSWIRFSPSPPTPP